MQNTCRNIAFAPYWSFGGFREVGFGTMMYHEVVARFDLLASSRDFISPTAIDGSHAGPTRTEATR